MHIQDAPVAFIKAESDRLILLIAYVIGLSIGVQLISYKEIPITAVLLIVFLMRWLLAPPSFKWGWLFTVLLSFRAWTCGLS